MKKNFLALALAGAMTLSMFASIAFADIAPLPQNRQIYFNVSNQDGARYGADASNSFGTYTDAYYIQAAGGGLNQLHITNDYNNAYGQADVKNIDTSSTSGTFWVSTTGGRGYNDDIILMTSVKGPISNDFSLSINSSGYQWTAQSTQVVGSDIQYVNNATSETFTRDDFLYGPQSAKPGPGTLGVWTLPLYSGQDINDASTAEYLMFIDLNLGNITSTKVPGFSQDGGSIKVDYTLTGLYDTTAAFNVYAWCLASNIGGGTVDWTNMTSASLTTYGISGLVINSTAAAPVPIPAAAWLLGSGFSGLFFMRRKKITA
ncbi:MAG: hypothetical protein VB050_00870 [Geobacteraceae bacterium]|nr:hypothetical protein [Geobacteraceae bacterium]